MDQKRKVHSSYFNLTILNSSDHLEEFKGLDGSKKISLFKT